MREMACDAAHVGVSWLLQGKWFRRTEAYTNQRLPVTLLLPGEETSSACGLQGPTVSAKRDFDTNFYSRNCVPGLDKPIKL